MSKFVPIRSFESRTWTAAQAKRVWRINAAAIAYFAAHTEAFDYHTQEGQDYFFAICWYFMTHPLIDESAPDRPDARERRRRERALDTYARSLRK